ncbi:MAG: YbhB/YbcL family Raf kinase inhibitor-like protein [Candidatus Paceibacterota bacterium]
MQIKSLAFKDNKEIPSLYTCDGNKINPPLEFLHVPHRAKSLVLIMEDPDIPESAKQNMNIEVWDHWIVFNIPPQTHMIEENTVPIGLYGRNTNGNNSYNPPCPPYGIHRYIFYLYALDAILELPQGVKKQDVFDAMEGHVLEEAKLIGLYQRK